MAVLILILIGACAFLVLQKYQVFDADGIHLRLPGDENGPAPESAQPLPEEDLVIDEKDPEVRELHGRTLDAAALPEETFSALLDGESPVLAMKAANGTLLFGNTEEPQRTWYAKKLRVNMPLPRISCFADTQQAGAGYGDGTDERQRQHMERSGRQRLAQPLCLGCYGVFDGCGEGMRRSWLRGNRSG